MGKEEKASEHMESYLAVVKEPPECSWRSAWSMLQRKSCTAIEMYTLMFAMTPMTSNPLPP